MREIITTFEVLLKPEDAALRLRQIAEEGNPYWDAISPAHRYVTEVRRSGPVSKTVRVYPDKPQDWSVTFFRSDTYHVIGPDRNLEEREAGWKRDAENRRGRDGLPRYDPDDEAIQVRLFRPKGAERTEVTVTLMNDSYRTEAQFLQNALLASDVGEPVAVKVEAPSGDRNASDAAENVQEIEVVDAAKPRPYESMPIPKQPKWSKKDWRTLFDYFRDAGMEYPDLKKISEVTGKEYNYVRQQSSKYNNGMLDDHPNITNCDP